MDKEQVKEYIQKYNNSHSKEAIKKQLQNSGAREKDIEEAFKEITPNPPQNTPKKGNSGLALGLVIAGFFIPFFGLIMIIVGIVLGFKARGIDKNDGMALAAIIIGFISLAIGFLIIPIVAIVGFQTWFTTYQSDVNVRVKEEVAQGPKLTIERLESDGTIYVKNTEDKTISIGQGRIISDTDNTLIPNCQSDNINPITTAGVSALKLSKNNLCNLTKNKIYNVILETNSGLISARMIAR